MANGETSGKSTLIVFDENGQPIEIVPFATREGSLVVSRQVPGNLHRPVQFPFISDRPKRKLTEALQVASIKLSRVCWLNRHKIPAAKDPIG